jgi:hypothetical protein
VRVRRVEQVETVNLEVDGRPPIRISERLDEFVNRALTRRVLDKKRLEVAP